MKDLLESSHFFVASSNLQSAAAALRKIEESQALDSHDRENLKWCGRFLTEVDWDTDCGSAEQISGDLSVQATEVRPSFYAALLNIQPALRRGGLRSDEARQQFFVSTYQLLASGGQKRKNNPQKTELELAAIFLDELAKALLLRLIETRAPADRNLADALLS